MHGTSSARATKLFEDKSMELINHTPFPALAFQATDQHGQSSHVVVMRATFEIKPDGTLEFSRDQEPIALTDEYFGETNKSSIKQESDLAPFKPKCDVIVNATAYAPGGKPSLGFLVGVRINCSTRTKDVAGALILEKKLLVTGPRCWEKSLMGGWTLKESAAPVVSLPVRYEYTFGGECRVNLDDPDGNRIKAEYRLTSEQRNCHPDGPAMAPIAHTTCENNPLGMGFAEGWYLKAKKIKTIPAPQIDSPQNPVTAFDKTYAPQGFGLITKSWKQRLKLAGTYDAAWFEERRPDLPEDFDMSFWNGANPEMQIPYPKGDEEITLTNLTPEGTLKFSLPGDLPFVYVFYADGKTASVPARLDTLIIEPSSMKVDIAWRAVIPSPPEIAVAEIRVIPNETD
jgi:hypothetical protein